MQYSGRLAVVEVNRCVACSELVIDDGRHKSPKSPPGSGTPVGVTPGGGGTPGRLASSLSSLLHAAAKATRRSLSQRGGVTSPDDVSVQFTSRRGRGGRRRRRMTSSSSSRDVAVAETSVACVM